MGEHQRAADRFVMGVAGHFSHGLRDGGGQSAARVPFGGDASARRVDLPWGMSWKRGSSKMAHLWEK